MNTDIRLTNKEYNEALKALAAEGINPGRTLLPETPETAEVKELTIDEIRNRKESLKDRRLQLNLPPTHFVSIYCKWMSGITDGYTEYQTMGALWLISSFCHYNVETRLKQEVVRPNIVVTLLGRSTTSRKTTAVNKARQIHESVTGNYLPNEDFSIEGYLESLAMNPVQHHVRDEVAGFLAKIHKQYNEGFNELECAIYDGQDFRKVLASKGNKTPKVFEVQAPYVTKLYATTPQNFCKFMEIEDFLCGKEYRTLFVFPTYQKPRMALGVETQEDNDNWIKVLERAKSIYSFIHNQKKVEFHFGDGALEFYSDVTSKIEEAADKLDDDILSSAVGRSQIHILKLAMLIELGKERLSNIITKESIAIAANAVISYFLPSLMDIVSQMQEDTKTNMIEKVLSVIRRRGGAVQHTQCLHDSKLKSRDFAEVIETMIESETIEKVIETKSKKTYYILTESKKSLDLSIFQPSTKNPQNPQNPQSLLVSHDKKNMEILESLNNIAPSDYVHQENYESNKNKETIPCEVEHSNNSLSLQKSPNFFSIGEPEILETPEIFEPKVVSGKEALKILEEECL